MRAVCFIDPHKPGDVEARLHNQEDRHISLITEMILLLDNVDSSLRGVRSSAAYPAGEQRRGAVGVPSICLHSLLACFSVLYIQVTA